MICEEKKCCFNPRTLRASLCFIVRLASVTSVDCRALGVVLAAVVPILFLPAHHLLSRSSSVHVSAPTPAYHAIRAQNRYLRAAEPFQLYGCANY